MENVFSNSLISKYIDSNMKSLKMVFPLLTEEEILEAVHYSIEKRIKDPKVVLHNSYKNRELDSSLLSIGDYIMKTKPIITSYGTMFKRHEEIDNPMSKVFKKFMDSRKINKKLKFEYERKQDWEKAKYYDLLQLLDKLDANALYGLLGTPSSIVYNLYNAASITKTGQLSSSVSAMFFESFLANNVKFRSLDEVVTFINNVIEEDRVFKDEEILDNNIDADRCFVQVISTCGHGYSPTEKHMDIIWNIINSLSQENINRVFYKNNLFDFIENQTIRKALIFIFKKLDVPFLDPNSPPEQIETELEALWDIIKEYVVYNHLYVDSVERIKFLPRMVTIYIDTDSNFICCEPWRKKIMELIDGVDMKIKTQELDLEDVMGMDVKNITPYEFLEYDDYNIIEDEYYEDVREVSPYRILPQDNLRYTIINTLAYFFKKLIDDGMDLLVENSNATHPTEPNLIRMKNEFLIKKMLLTHSKRSYICWNEYQEGNKIPAHKQLEIKGLNLRKSTMNEASKQQLINILTNEILNSDNISYVRIIKELVKVEKNIIDNIRKGSKDFYKPVVVKNANSYDDPMRIAGIKASIVWNKLKDTSYEAINLDEGNALDIAKVNITKKNVKEVFKNDPYRLEKSLELFDEGFKREITSIAIPPSITEIPQWLLNCIDYNTVVSDVISNFTKVLEGIGLEQTNKNIDYCNIVKI